MSDMVVKRSSQALPPSRIIERGERKKKGRRR
jgi:hypothetical protein